MLTFKFGSGCYQYWPLHNLETHPACSTMPLKYEFTPHWRQTTLVLIRSAASKKNDCATANELLKPSTCEAQIDLYTASTKGEHRVIENL